MQHSKSVFFVSLGPGDPELVTLKALKCLQEVVAVYCPATVAKTGKSFSRAYTILEALNIDRKKIHKFDVPMSKERTRTKQDYELTANAVETLFHSQDQSIAICAQGDASFYSSIYYISELLKSKNIKIQRVAGVPAFIAAGTLANIHIVKQEQNLRVIPGVTTYDELVKECTPDNTVVIMKTPQSEMTIKRAISNFEQTTFHYFENVGVIGKEFYTHDKQVILERKFPYFSLLIIQTNAA